MRSRFASTPRIAAKSVQRMGSSSQGTDWIRSEFALTTPRKLSCQLRRGWGIGMDYRAKIEAYRLANASTPEAIAWLEETTPREMPRWRGESKARHVVEYLLFRRHEPSLDLALARFGTYAPVLRKLCRTGNKATQLAVMTNMLVGPREFLGPETAFTQDDIVGLIQGFPRTKNLLQAYFENPHIPRETLEHILRRDKEFSFIDDITLCHLVSYLPNNKIISEPRDETYLDGFGDYMYNRLFFALLNLVGTVPTEQYWAHVLAPVVQKVHLPFIPKELTTEIINRWKIEKPTNEVGSSRGGENTAADESYEQLKKRAFDPQLSSSFWLRHALAIRFLRDGYGEYVESITPDHGDKAIRLAYFSACRPHDIFGHFIEEKNFEYPNFKYHREYSEYLDDGQRKIIAICNKYFDRDKNDFVDNVIRNENFWQRRQEREFLLTLAWDLAEDPYCSMDVPNTLRAYEARLIKEKPQLFEDDDFIDNTQDAPVDDLLHTIIEDLGKVSEKLEDTQVSDLLEHQKDLYQEIIDETQRRLDSLNRQISNQLEESSVEYFLSSLSQRLSKIEGKIRRPSWALTVLLIAAAAVIGVWLGRQ
jgi:hypothetical protein